MNQPTEERFKRIEEEQRRLKEEVKQLREQRTEEIRAVRVEVASEDVIRRLDNLKQDLTQELNTISETWLDTLQEHYDEHKEAISGVQTVQSGHSKFFEEHGKRLAATATKSDISRLESDITSIKATQEQILKLLQPKPGE